MRTSHPEPVGPISQFMEDGFYARRVVTESCHVWSGSLKGCGHGKMPKRAGRGSPQVLAHRLSYAIHKGEPGNNVVRHTCDNPWCVAPYHLVLGSFADNVRDAFERGQLSTRGANSPMHRLGRARFDPDSVREVRRLLTSGRTQAEVARIFGVRGSHIADIRLGRKWGWVE